MKRFARARTVSDRMGSHGGQGRGGGRVTRGGNDRSYEVLKTETAAAEDVAATEASQLPKELGNSFLKSWTWKREHRSDRDRFELPYKHKLRVSGKDITLTIGQRPYTTTGFASTVWDSAIVLSKYMERWPSLVAGKRCVELGAGCGLPGIVAATLGAKEVVLTDLPENLSLLRANVAANQQVANNVSVEPLTWGADPSHLRPPYDIVIATDVMYIVEISDSLITTLRDLSMHESTLLLAYGRNRRAEDVFMSKVGYYFEAEHIAESALDAIYKATDVDTYRLRLTKR